MNAIFTVLGTLGSVFAAVMTALSMINYRKPRKITTLSIFLSGLISLLSLAAMVWLGGMRLASYLSAPLFMIGLLLGYLRGAGVKLNWENGQVIGRNSILFLILWGLSLALSQLLGLFGSPLLASLGLIPVFFTTGLQAGLFGHLFLRRLIMGRKGKTRKGLQVVIGLGGGFGILLITVISFLILGPDLTDAFLRTGDRPPALSYQEEVASVGSQSATAEPSLALMSGQLPASGSLVTDCSDQMEKEKEQSLISLNFGTTNYSFEEAFTDYSIQINMEANLSDGEFSFDYIKHEGWRWQEFDPDQYAPEYATLINFDDTIMGEGTLREDGWITGEFYWTMSNGGVDEEPTIETDYNNFYGYIDNENENIDICLLAVFGYGEPEDFIADFEALRAAGKDQLVSGWGTNNCYSCAIIGVEQ